MTFPINKRKRILFLTFLIILLSLLLFSLSLLLLPEPPLLPIPAPIPSSHKLTSEYQKGFLIKKVRIGISDTSINAKLGVLINLGTLSHKEREGNLIK